MIGQLLGQYRIDARLGAGAMGVVYRAYDTRLHRTVAIKRLENPSPELSAAKLLEEARAASTLNHPHICTIHEVAEIDGHAFIVMEYVDGRPLNELIPKGGLPLESVLEYGSQIADALGFAHECGIVHRDLKTSNIVVTHGGRAKVLDFGLARRLPDEVVNDVTRSIPLSPLTTTDLAGTPAYMPPEVLRGEAATARSDVWSLGIVLYEMAVGRRPYDGRTPFALAAEVMSESPVVMPPEVAPSLAAVIKRCLAKQPGRRYRQAGEARAALEAVQPSAVGIPPVQSPRRSALPRGVTAGLALVAGLILVSAFGVERLRDRLARFVAEPAIAFGERDWLLVTDFNNQTGDPVFDRALNTALSAALAQSRYVNLVPSTRIHESLRRMDKANLERTDEAAGREIAQREGFRMVLAPTIASTGGSYLLAASLLHPPTGATLKSETVQARTKADVLGALDELSRRIRGDLGEATAMIAEQAKPLARVSTSSLEALQRFSLGREAHMAQQIEKARSLYEEALRLDPAFTAARASLGIINFEFFDRAKGVDLVAQAIKAVDGLTDTERVSVVGFHAMVVERNLEKAADTYRAFLAAHPDTATAHNNLGRIYMQMRRFDEAVTELQETIRLDPDLFLAYFSLNAIYLYEIGDLDAAIATAQRQLARNDRSARAYGQLGAAYVGKDDLRQAEIALRKSLDLDPRFVLDSYRLGHTLRLQGRFDEARQTYLHILEIDPMELSAQYEAGAASQLMGDEASARRYLRQVVTESERRLRENPRDGERQLELAATLARLGNAARAQAVARGATPFTADLAVERAGLLTLLGRTDEAIETLDRAAESGFRNIVWIRTSSDLHALHGDTRLDAIVAKMRPRR
jgi:tetratricopeptide (TPR) repeat protein/predicted Ser/Thr protein kinase